MAERVAAFDWSQTPLGPKGSWPQSLRTAVALCLNNPFPMAIWWGPELNLIHNDAYTPILGKRSADAMGQPYRKVWAEVWPQVEPLIESARRGETIVRERQHFTLERNGHAEDSVITYTLIPIPDETGEIAGLGNACIEETERVRAEREREQLAGQRRQADERCRTILESITDAFFATDREFNFTHANPQGEKLLGRKPGELIGLNLYKEYAGIVGTAFDRIYKTANYDGQSGSATIYYPDHDRWYEAHAYPSPDGMSVFFRDVSEQERTQEALRVSEERRRLALSSAKLGSFNIVNVNELTTDERFRAIFGITADQLSYEGAFEAIHPEDRDVVREAVANATRPENPIPYSTEHRVIHPDGSIHWVSVSGGATFSGAGADRKMVSFDGTVADITERRLHEESIRESEARNTAVLAALDEGISLHDETGAIIMANAGAERILGLTLDQMLGIDSLDPHWRGLAADGSDLPGTEHPPQIALRTGRPVSNMVMGINHADGHIVWVTANAVLLRDPKTGKVTGAVTSFADITARRKSEQEREHLLDNERAARAEIERASHMKDEFLATLSHEIRTPLNAILGWSQIMKSSTDAEDMAQGIEVIERNARAQSQIIEDLLDMSRIINGKVRLDVQRLDLAHIVEAAVENARPTSDAKGVRMQSVIDPLHGVTVSGDISRLQQVLWNLINNAVKFTPKGGRVQVVLERVNSHLELSVIDTGEGIAPDFLPFIFDRFRQADGSTTRRHGGLGIGLSITKQLVELHGGSIAVKSAGIGSGATFVVSLPLISTHQGDGGPDRHHPRMPQSLRGTYSPREDIKGIRVLVIDDEPDSRLLVKRVLEDNKAIVSDTSSVDEIVALVKTGQFDVLVSDIGMPGEDGYSLIRRVRLLGREHGGDIPAIALTAYARAEDRMKAVSAGFQMHVAKPVEPVELVTMVAGAAGRTGPIGL